MSDPTYRIDVEHRPQEQGSLKWIARVVRLSDSRDINSRWGDTAEEALTLAQELVAQLNTQQESFQVYVDDDGRPVEAHSVKAS